MDAPLFIQMFSEKRGKPISAFTAKDWKDAALKGAELITYLSDELAKTAPKKAKKKPGRPPHKNMLLGLLSSNPKSFGKRYGNTVRNLGFSNVGFPDWWPPIIPSRRGRKQATYYGLSAGDLARLVTDVEKHPKAPNTEIEIIRGLASNLRTFREAMGVREYHDPNAIARAIRRVRAADKNRRKII